MEEKGLCLISSTSPTGDPQATLCLQGNLITFHKHEDMCRTVFSMLLGDTLWIDSLDEANSYRIELVKYTNCPTILTRDGDRIRSNGKFGGLMNKAPTIEKLRGVVFGAPVSEKYHQICSVIDSLTSLKSSLLSHQTAAEELSDQLAVLETPEMKTKYEECREAEKQLTALERRIGVKGMGTPQQSSTALMPKITKRTPDPDDSPQVAKRSRTSSGHSEVNGSSTPSTPATSFPITPTRTSRRLASQSPASAEGRKKFKTS